MPENPLATTFIVCGVVIEKDGKYLLLILFSAVAGGVIALLGAVFGLGSQVVKESPFDK